MFWASPGFRNKLYDKIYVNVDGRLTLFYELISLLVLLNYDEFSVLVVRNMTFKNGDLT